MAKGISVHVGLNEVDPRHYRDADGQPWRGELRACENDARAMAALAQGLGFDVRPALLTASATSDEVTSAIQDAGRGLGPGDMLFLTYSGHGGQVANANHDDDPEEDTLDETWCLFDRQLLDDELFALFGDFGVGVRIVVFSDSCHSGTVTRADPSSSDGLPAAKQLPLSVARATEREHKDMYAAIQRAILPSRMASMRASVVLLSGCEDHEFSRDGAENGAFTKALLEAWEEPRSRKSMRHLREATAERIPSDFQQHPNLFTYAFEVEPPLAINSAPE